MLQKPEVGSKEHIIMWLSSRRPEETYFWGRQETCACGIYAKAHGIVNWVHNGPATLWDWLNSIAQRASDGGVGTMGDLYKAAYRDYYGERL